jgi:hypothetical protein
MRNEVKAVSAEVQEAIRLTGAKARISSLRDSRSFRDAAAQKYAAAPPGSRLWERLDGRSKRSPNGWRMVGAFLGDESCILFFDPGEEATAFEFDEGKQLTPVLENCFGFEFYVTDSSLSYVLCFNHHDVLLGVGRAADWIADWNASED